MVQSESSRPTKALGVINSSEICAMTVLFSWTSLSSSLIFYILLPENLSLSTKILLIFVPHFLLSPSSPSNQSLYSVQDIPSEKINMSLDITSIKNLKQNHAPKTSTINLWSTSWRLWTSIHPTILLTFRISEKYFRFWFMTKHKNEVT